ncbi:MAG: DUF935 domain-containing protein [Alphaproteobacteria bacterium]
MTKSKNNRKEMNIQQIVKKELSPSAEWYKSRSFGDVIYPEDDILRKNGYQMKIYRSLLSDEQIKACFSGQRVAAVVAADWEIIPASDSSLDKEIAEFVSKNIEQLMFDDKSRKMLHANWFGYSVAEVIWGLDDDKIIIKDLKIRRQERFCFGVNGDLFLKKNLFEKERMPDKKFWVLKASGDNDDDVYGLGLANSCYWPVYLKRNGLKFWSVLVEKFAIPTAVGKYVQGASEEEIKDLLQMLDAISSETSIAVPEGTDVDLLESIKASGGDHEKFCKYLDQIIAKAILGQDGTSENGRYAGTAEVQENVKDLIVKSDADLLCESFDEVIKWLVAYNWPDAIAPKIVRKFEQVENLNTSVDRDVKISSMGFMPTEEYIQEKYGGSWKKSEAGSPLSNFSESEDEEENNEDVSDWEEIVDPMLKPFEKLLENCSSFEELSSRLLETVNSIDTTKLVDELAKQNFLARVKGVLGVKDE